MQVCCLLNASAGHRDLVTSDPQSFMTKALLRGPLFCRRVAYEATRSAMVPAAHKENPMNKRKILVSTVRVAVTLALFAYSGLLF